jgi:hypothetical protein
MDDPCGDTHQPAGATMSEKQSKQQMIDALVQFSVESVLKNQEWLAKMFTEGVTGFRGLSEAQLRQEMQFRGLLEFDDEPEQADDDEDEDEDIDDELERLVAWSGMVTVETPEWATE